MVRASGLVVVLLGLPALGSAATFRAHLRRPRHGLQVRLSPITVAPGSEREVCQLVTLPNRKAMDASEITMAMPSGATYTSHHFAIFLYQGEHPEGIPSGPFDRVGCPGVERPARSEEHTSELQSRGHLVCRLLLEKKKKKNKQSNTEKSHTSALAQ